MIYKKVKKNAPNVNYSKKAVENLFQLFSFVVAAK